jgi:hypothetical protein
VAVMGPSGSGKTTLLALAGGLDRPTSGQVLVEGASLDGMSIGELAKMRRRRVGYVFQQYNLIDGLTAVENVSMPLELDGVGRRQATVAAMRALHDMGLGEFAHIASLPLALAIVAVAVALVASETRRSRQILVTVGAGPTSHRKLLAATSWLLATIAAVLAVPGGLLPLIVAAGQSDIPLKIPWATIGVVLFLVPLLAALVSGIVARTPRLGLLLRPAI